MRDLIIGLSARPRVMAALSGALTALAQPPFGFMPGLLGYGLLLFALDRDLGPKPLRTAAFMGWLAGFCYFFISCFWVAEAFLVDAQTYGWMAPFAATLLPAGIGLFWGTFAALYVRFKSDNWTRFLFFAALFS
ncbi:MAG: apolipoprotein N-acyltransferase, partial [Asticcacaulis sp.]